MTGLVIAVSSALLLIWLFCRKGERSNPYRPRDTGFAGAVVDVTIDTVVDVVSDAVD